MRRTLTIGLSAVLIGTLASVSPAAPPNAMEATVRPYSAPSTEQLYPARDGSGASISPQAWRVVSKTGNCCENYIAATSSGRVMDFGGGKIRHTDDLGASWNEVSSLPTIGGEGAVVQAPGGDIVGITWDPYTGDRLEAFKFEAESGKWFYVENSLHQPFFDRPYISVIPGPFEIGGTTVPYLTYMTGGWPEKTTYMSTDGLNYVPAPSPHEPLGSPKSEYPALKPDPSADWTQPLTVPGIAPLPGGGALAWKSASNDTVSFGDRNAISVSILQPPSTTWSPFTFPDKQLLKGRVLADSAGRLHNVSMSTRAVDYQITSDGGKTWSGASIQLPAGYEAIAPTFDRFWDFKANAALDMAVVSLYARNTSTGKDQNLLLVLSTVGGKPRMDKMLFAGRGDKAFGIGLGYSDRLDFITVAILPGGQIATTFMDTQSSAPVLGITSSSQVPSPVAPPEPSPSVDPSVAPEPTVAPSTSPTPEPTDSPAEPVDSTSPAITAVSDRPDPITPNGDGRRDRVRINFTISEDADVTVLILNKRGRLVRTIREAVHLGSGTHRATWTGRNAAGRVVRGGTYFYEISAVDAAGNSDQTTEGTVTVRAPR